MSKLELEKLIRDVPDFPKKGIIFKDITPLLSDRFSETINEVISLIDWDGIECVAGIESRGFIFAAAIAQKLDIGFIPIRKKGKLPPPVISESYSLEYGEDTLEVSTLYNKQKVIIVDDVIATGGTLSASIKLCNKANLEIHGCLALINLSFLNDLKNSEIPIKSVFEY